MTKEKETTPEPIKVDTTVKPKDGGSTYETFGDKSKNAETADSK